MFELAMSASKLANLATSMSIPTVPASMSRIRKVQFLPIPVVVSIIGGDTVIALAVASTVSKARIQVGEL